MQNTSHQIEVRHINVKTISHKFFPIILLFQLRLFLLNSSFRVYTHTTCGSFCHVVGYWCALFREILLLVCSANIIITFIVRFFFSQIFYNNIFIISLMISAHNSRMCSNDLTKRKWLRDYERVKTRKRYIEREGEREDEALNSKNMHSRRSEMDRLFMYFVSLVLVFICSLHRTS